MRYLRLTLLRPTAIAELVVYGTPLPSERRRGPTRAWSRTIRFTNDGSCYTCQPLGKWGRMSASAFFELALRVFESQSKLSCAR